MKNKTETKFNPSLLLSYKPRFLEPVKQGCEDVDASFGLKCPTPDELLDLGSLALEKLTLEQTLTCLILGAGSSHASTLMIAVCGGDLDAAKNINTKSEAIQKIIAASDGFYIALVHAGFGKLSGMTSNPLMELMKMLKSDEDESSED